MNILVFLVIAALLILIEWILWRLFKAKIGGMLFPHETDHSALSFFTIGRLRLCAIAHTIFLLLCAFGATMIFFPFL